MPPSPVSTRRTRIRIAVAASAAVALATGAALILVSGPDPAPGTPTGADRGGPSSGPVGSADLLAYTGPEEDTRIDLGPGPYTLPDDPCAVPTAETLAGLGHTADSGVPGDHGCSWSTESADGGLHGLSLTYTSWEDAEQARLRFDEEFDRVRDGGGTPHWDQASNAGEQSRLALASRDGTHLATLLARHGEVHVTVARTYTPGTGGGAAPERSAEVRLMPELGRQALNGLG
ncbi:hypothetical protein SUDANB121_04912 [Nocardiopsis dassonvillei]|uniref:hypothetical protein n=1 Tax=Nocardiopsis dassonvillei TaxID=2014 RepID=UPI003F550EED